MNAHSTITASALEVLPLVNGQWRYAHLDHDALSALKASDPDAHLQYTLNQVDVAFYRMRDSQIDERSAAAAIEALPAGPDKLAQAQTLLDQYAVHPVFAMATMQRLSRADVTFIDMDKGTVERPALRLVAA